MTSLLMRSVGNQYALDLQLHCSTAPSNSALSTWEMTLEATPRQRTESFILATATAHTVNLAEHGAEEAFAALSGHSPAMQELAEITHTIWGKRIMLIAGDTVEIHEDYRGLGIGPLLAADILPRLGGDDYVSVLLAAPLDSDDLDIGDWSGASKSIGSAWSHTGFKPILGGYHYLTSDTLSIAGSGENFRNRSVTSAMEATA